MRVWIIRAVLVIVFFGTIASEGLARRTYFTPEQKAQLQAIHPVWVKGLVLTERGNAMPRHSGYCQSALDNTRLSSGHEP